MWSLRFKPLVIFLLTIMTLLCCINSNSELLETQLIALTDETYDEFTLSNDNTLIFFYFKPCALCNQIIPELEKVINQLSSLSVKFASVECQGNPQIKRRLNVDKMSIRLIHQGKPIDYKGGRTSDEVVNWVKKYLSVSIGEVNSVKDLEELRLVVRSMAVFFGEEEQLMRKFADVAKKDQIKMSNHNSPIYLVCKSEECLEFYKVNNGNVVVFIKYDEGKKEFRHDDYTEEELEEFIRESSKPSVMKFDMATANLIFEQGTPGLFIYRSKSDFEDDTYYSLLTQVSPMMKGKLQPVISDIVDVAESKLADMMGIKEKDLPLLMIHDTRDVPKTYRLEKSQAINKENIYKFVHDWENNSLTRHIKSSVEPKTQNGDTFALVGSTFERHVLDTGKDVLVMFYAPWCKHSKEFMPVYESVSRTMKLYENLLIAKFDLHYNEPSLMKLQYIPTIVLWKADDKTRYVEFDQERTEENLFKFLKKNVRLVKEEY